MQIYTQILPPYTIHVGLANAEIDKDQIRYKNTVLQGNKLFGYLPGNFPHASMGPVVISLFIWFSIHDVIARYIKPRYFKNAIQGCSKLLRAFSLQYVLCHIW